jgi:hypothetical protein
MGVNANSTLQHAQNFTLATFAATFGAFFGTPFYQIKTRFQGMLTLLCGGQLLLRS